MEIWKKFWLNVESHQLKITNLIVVKQKIVSSESFAFMDALD